MLSILSKFLKMTVFLILKHEIKLYYYYLATTNNNIEFINLSDVCQTCLQVL